MTRHSERNAFSLVELVMVVVIIAIIAAIAVPRVSRASRKASLNALKATIANVGTSIDHFYAEHSRYPGFNPDTFAPDGAAFVGQLTKYTSEGGKVGGTKNASYKFGPYLRLPFPTNPINNLSSVAVKARVADLISAGGTGWIACLEDGSFAINSTEADVEQFVGADLNADTSRDLGIK